MPNPIKTLLHRHSGMGLPETEEIELFGSDGEEAVYRILRQNFDCVLRNVVVPHKDLFLEKDFMVIHKGVPFVLEIKNWKGEIGMEGDRFYQNKENGVHKTLKSPVGTTNQFIRCLKNIYEIERCVYGMVVFAEPSCTLSLPPESEGVALLPVKQMVSYIRSRVKEEGGDRVSVKPDAFLRCTRFYSNEREFCKGVLVDCELECYNEKGDKVYLDTTKLEFLSLERQPLRMRDKLYVTYYNGASGVFYNRDTVLTLKLLDGSFQRLALNRIRHIVF